MTLDLKFRFVSKDKELEVLKNKLEDTFQKIDCVESIDEAIEKQDVIASDVFILSPSFYFQSHLNTISKQNSPPLVVLGVADKIPNLAKILTPMILYSDWNKDEIRSSMLIAYSNWKKDKRLLALRDHHKRGANLDKNPIVGLVTSLMNKCTKSEEMVDIALSAHSLSTTLEFDDLILFSKDENNEILDSWIISKENRMLPSKLNLEKGTNLSKFSFENESITSLFQSSDPNYSYLNEKTIHPWSFGLSLNIGMKDFPRKPKSISGAVFLFIRRQLIPFNENDRWLVELAYGPLCLALEKVCTLKAIGQASKEWRSTFDAISEPLTVVDSGFNIVKANRPFATLVDVDVKKVKGRKCFSLLANRRTPCNSCPIKNEQYGPFGARIQTRGTIKRDLLAWSYGIRSGIDKYYFQFYRDVSKESELSSKLIQSEKMAALGRVVGAIAHEINNPIAGILATSQLLMSESLNSNQLEDIQEIRSAAWRSKKIIDDLLGFTQDTDTSLKNIDVIDVIRSTVVFTKSASKGVEIIITSEPEKIFALASIGILQQVLFNLITNACQAMNSQGKIFISSLEESSKVIIKVRDTGPGIPKEKLKNVFDPFVTTKAEGFGTGLGLSIVRNLVKKINGEIEISSSTPSGTEFIITLNRGSF
ncbi:MAG: HAMP domain-containing histidine kinase [Oligoflexia bacterium]|nr:HAMP domain-containing histidine kinase [Oligoflexia bacterium]